MLVDETFLARVVTNDATGCWIWQGSRGHGYGYVYVSKDRPWVRAHRWSYERWVGPIPGGLELDHLCRNRACVNPVHLEPVVARENIRRSPSHEGSRMVCPQGHPYDPTNTYVYMQHGGQHRHRQCRTCVRTRSLARYHARKGK